MHNKTMALSVLDLAPIVEGETPAHALRNSLELARHAESLGYTRYWVAEHHNMQGIASAATSVVIGYLAGGTSRIRVGAGGIMLPNHSPLVIAEQFGTLEALYQGRIDLALGRAPGTDQRTARALRRDWSDPDQFPRDVLELQALLGPVQPDQAIVAVPGAGSQVPLWILGSSLYGAQLAAALGLPYAFASHFAPEALQPRSPPIAAVSSLPRNSSGPTPWRAPMCSLPTAIARRSASSPARSSSSPTWPATAAASSSRRSTISRATG